MAINMMCMNSNCKYYWEDNCMRNMNEERLEINEYGKCVTFVEGTNELYNCEYSQNGKCVHAFSEGELYCDGTELEKLKCMCHSEMENKD